MEVGWLADTATCTALLPPRMASAEAGLFRVMTGAGDELPGVGVGRACGVIVTMAYRQPLPLIRRLAMLSISDAASVFG